MKKTFFIQDKDGVKEVPGWSSGNQHAINKTKKGMKGILVITAYGEVPDYLTAMVEETKKFLAEKAKEKKNET